VKQVDSHTTGGDHGTHIYKERFPIKEEKSLQRGKGGIKKLYGVREASERSDKEEKEQNLRQLILDGHGRYRQGKTHLGERGRGWGLWEREREEMILWGLNS